MRGIFEPCVVEHAVTRANGALATTLPRNFQAPGKLLSTPLRRESAQGDFTLRKKNRIVIYIWGKKVTTACAATEQVGRVAAMPSTCRVPAQARAPGDAEHLWSLQVEMRFSVVIAWTAGIVVWCLICSGWWYIATRDDYARLDLARACYSSEARPPVTGSQCTSAKPSDIRLYEAAIDRRASISRLASALGGAAAIALLIHSNRRLRGP